MQSAYEFCAELVRNADKDRYLAGLFLPDATRPHIFALYAFNAELAQVRDRANQPLAGEVRLQWWRDAVLEGESAQSGTNPVLTALLDTIKRFRLSREKLVALIEARMFDLYNDPMPSLYALENYLASTASTVFELASEIAEKDTAPDAQLSKFAGNAFGITGLLRNFPLHASRGQIFVPAEILSRHGVSEDDVLTGKGSPALLDSLAEMRSMARTNLEKATSQIERVTPAHRTIFLPLALVDAYLSRMDRDQYNPFTTRIEISQLRKQWILWRAARRIR